MTNSMFLQPVLFCRGQQACRKCELKDNLTWQRATLPSLQGEKGRKLCSCTTIRHIFSLIKPFYVDFPSFRLQTLKSAHRNQSELKVNPLIINPKSAACGGDKKATNIDESGFLMCPFSLKFKVKCI